MLEVLGRGASKPIKQQKERQRILEGGSPHATIRRKQLLQNMQPSRKGRVLLTPVKRDRNATPPTVLTQMQLAASPT